MLVIWIFKYYFVLIDSNNQRALADIAQCLQLILQTTLCG